MTIFEISLFWLTIAPTYYGLMYVIWFIYGLYFLKRSKKYTENQIDALFLYIFLWTVLWGRIGYVLFYNFSAYLADPLSILRVWDWWMSFHWWFLGVVIALIVFSKIHRVFLWSLADTIAMIIPVGLFFGRIWNYINKELLGFPYVWPLSVSSWGGRYFPSPLLEAVLEWLLIFVLFHFVLRKPSFPWQFAALFLILYWIFRTWIEIFIRTPDPQIWYYFWFLTQWSILSIPMVIIWIWLYYYLAFKKHGAK